ncbi:VOC family protein [Pedomonas mirosovicensis]|uniref:VOC family protein n=1 Tax=Pedomonas mirosovicensis TaxID=2908641 RepID=UPI00216AACD9|nr:VOC family protein [Pedomonas mirosovicensis]MCH8685325.1 VOC family protein [Pedomonas mirosovicensis]
MIGYVTLGTHDMERGARFYDSLLPLLGGKRAIDFGTMIFWGNGKGGLLCLTHPYNKEPATVGNGVMVAFTADSPAQVDEVYAKAIELGGQCEGAPGRRGGENSPFYGAYFRDPDGNKLAVFHWPH